MKVFIMKMSLNCAEEQQKNISGLNQFSPGVTSREFNFVSVSLTAGWVEKLYSPHIMHISKHLSFFSLIFDTLVRQPWPKIHPQAVYQREPLSLPPLFWNCWDEENEKLFHSHSLYLTSCVFSRTVCRVPLCWPWPLVAPLTFTLSILTVSVLRWHRIVCVVGLTRHSFLQPEITEVS